MTHNQQPSMPREPYLPLQCRLFGHMTWNTDDSACLRCHLPTDHWPDTRHAEIVPLVYHVGVWPLERWWRLRRPSQRWPYYTRCDHCGKIDRIWTRAVGEHTTACLVL